MTHTAVQGEFVSSIAEKYGFYDYRTIWDHPANAELKKKRPDPNVLFPEDEIFIPEKQQKTESRPTGGVHQFLVPFSPVMLRIALRDFDDRPIVNTKCELEIAGEVTQHTSDPDGIIEREIPPVSAAGTLRVPDLDFELDVKVGHLDPPDETSGWTARLINLGYLDASVKPDEDDVGSAIQEFQCDHKLPVTGAVDPATRAKLLELHGA